jgi:hypothetical protein
MAVRWLLAIAGVLAVALVETWSLLPDFGTHLPSEGGDVFFLAYVLTWVAHALATDPLRLFDANIAYPLPHTLAMSDHLLGLMPLFAPVYWSTGNAVAAYNTVLLLSGPLGALGGFALARWWTGRWWPALVAGVLFGWVPLRLSQFGHIQMLSVFWSPWALLFLDRFLRTRRWRDLWAFAAFYWLQVLGSFYLGMMLTLAVALYVGYHALAVDRGILDRAMAKRAAAFVVASLAVLLPTHLPYLEVRRAWEAAWTPGALAGFSADVQSYLAAPPAMNDLYVALFRPVIPSGAHERLLFPGLVWLVLVALGCLAGVKGVDRGEVRRARRTFGLLAVVAFVLSLGPYLVVWGVNTRVPMPYLLLYYVIPGWSAMRVPARFAFLLFVVLIPLAALGAQASIERAAAWREGPGWRRLAAPATALALIALFLLELGAKPLPRQAVATARDAPEVYRWLARERPGPTVEIPVDFTGRDQKYLFLSTLHWLPVVNGRSSFAPPSYDAMKHALGELPGPRARQYAAALGLEALVVHGDELSAEARSRWAAAERAGALRRLAAFGPDVVYAVEPVTLAPALRVQLAAPPALAAGSSVTLGLRLETDGTGPWAQRPPYRLARGTARWTSLDGGTPHERRVSVMLPLVVGAKESAPVPLRLDTPAKAGRYVLDVALDVSPRLAARRTVEVRDGSQRQDGTRLAVRYVLPDRDSPRGLDDAIAGHLHVVAVNTGDAIWLSKGRGKRGAVALEWRWLDATGRALAEGSGRTRLRYEVHPGQSYRFDEWPLPPTAAGRYVLEAGLVVEGVGPFPAEGPLTLAVDVGARS